MKRALNDYRRVDGQFKWPGGSDNTGLKDHVRFEEEAAQGSRALREAMEKSIFKFGFKHGIRKDQAAALLLDRKMVA